MNPTSHWISKLPLAAVLCTLLFATSSPAATIYYSGLVNIAIPTTFEGVYLDLGSASIVPSSGSTIETDSFTVGYSEPGSWDVNFFFGGIGIAYSDTFQPFVDDAGDIFSQILNVTYGTVIEEYATTLTLTQISFGGSGANDGEGASHFDENPDNFSEFESGVTGYIAFVLNPGIDEFYGWLRVTLKNDGTVGTIHEWAYSSDESFQVGQIPEPRAALLGGIGMLLLLRRRHR